MIPGTQVPKVEQKTGREAKRRRLCGLYKNRKGLNIHISPLLNYGPHHEVLWESGVIAPRILNLVLDGCELFASRLGHFCPEERAPSADLSGD
jgi:hypothetical protein